MGLLASIMDSLVVFQTIPAEQDGDRLAFERRKRIINFANEAGCDPVLLAACMAELEALKSGTVATFNGMAKLDGLKSITFVTFNDHAGVALFIARNLTSAEKGRLLEKHNPRSAFVCKL